MSILDLRFSNTINCVKLNLSRIKWSIQAGIQPASCIQKSLSNSFTFNILWKPCQTDNLCSMPRRSSNSVCFGASCGRACSKVWSHLRGCPASHFFKKYLEGTSYSGSAVCSCCCLAWRKRWFFIHSHWLLKATGSCCFIQWNACF